MTLELVKDKNTIEIEFKEAWLKAKPLLEKAIKHQKEYTIDDIHDKISQGIFLLWPGKQSVMITEFIDFPRLRAMNLLFCGGDYEELASMLPSLEAFAKNAGATKLFGGGRKGWLRKIKHLGFKPEYIISKEL